ncbi:hypothetical protein CCACVL1_07704 [Corchorus capsularis]|uniref:Uncharacterized protein n=1 Tax=Corchorus capsularis TaxID=210143 RepID=A0A1R3J4C4_COCAP|nr:hypothetical protein CCACVL1_07704 [Corchorus capsularis]
MKPKKRKRGPQKSGHVTAQWTHVDKTRQTHVHLRAAS